MASIATACFLLLAACDAPEPAAVGPGEVACDRGGLVQAELYGAIRTSIHWQPDTLSCEGMPRPGGAGARLRLSGPVEVDGSPGVLAFILGIPGLVKDETGKELPTNVTLLREGSGRFFGTQDTGGCWTDIDRHEAASAEGPSVYRISGTVYCISSLAELNGGSSIRFTELKFTSRLDWELPE